MKRDSLSQRRYTHPVYIRDVVMSSSTPIVPQSMLNVSTMDTQACVEQAIRVFEAGGELVRITAQGVREAENLKNIREELDRRGYMQPISADIHFVAEAAMVAAQYADKVRINPGNFVDKRAVFEQIDYTEEEYKDELLRLKEKFTSFLDICRAHNTAVRIGTNHGSLSDRIMSRYGNTPEGMVEATMEYLRVCKAENFTNVVVSLKSSDCHILVTAIRLLVLAMDNEQMTYPLHLGVTEAGEGEDGRIRSAIGIGALLNEGYGDTIRVSLTEDPEKEIPVAKELISLASPSNSAVTFQRQKPPFFARPIYIADLSGCDIIDNAIDLQLDFEEEYDNHPVYGRRLKSSLKSPEYIYTQQLSPKLSQLPHEVGVIVDAELIDVAHTYTRNAIPLYTIEQIRDITIEEYHKVALEIESLDQISDERLNLLRKLESPILILSGVLSIHHYNALLARLEEIDAPKIIKTSIPQQILALPMHLGALFLDKKIDGLWLESKDIVTSINLSRNILQSSGARRYKPEFISCPGCGRTLFDLQGTVAKVKHSFAHLNNLKIAVMGCVVNGPGEMGDADYGYVGAGNAKVNLYKSGNLVMKAVPEDQAIEKLKELIKEGGDWIE